MTALIVGAVWLLSLLAAFGLGAWLERRTVAMWCAGLFTVDATSPRARRELQLAAQIAAQGIGRAVAHGEHRRQLAAHKREA